VSGQLISTKDDRLVGRGSTDLETPGVQEAAGQRRSRRSMMPEMISGRSYSICDSDYSASACPTETFTSGLSTMWSPASSLEMTTWVTGQVPRSGLSPLECQLASLETPVFFLARRAPPSTSVGSLRCLNGRTLSPSNASGTGYNANRQGTTAAALSFVLRGAISPLTVGRRRK
jgi:hypothetical protein